MVATVETISEPKLYGKRRSTSISSAASVVSLTDQRSRITDQKLGISGNLFIDQCSLVIEKGGAQALQANGAAYAADSTPGSSGTPGQQINEIAGWAHPEIGSAPQWLQPLLTPYDFEAGAFNAVGNMIGGTGSLLENPISTAANLALHPVDAAEAAWGGIAGTVENLFSGQAYQTGEAVGNIGMAVLPFAGELGAAEGAASVVTSRGYAVQSLTPEAMALRDSVAEGQQIFRAGNFPESAGAEGQYWSGQSPLAPGYANSVGAANLWAGTPDFILGGSVNPGANFITRYAPAFGRNAGGALEIVTQPNGVQIEFFHMP